MGRRRRARELALQLLYQQDIGRSKAEEIRETFWVSNPVNQTSREFAELLFTGYLENRVRVDGLIQQHAQHWRIERMAAVDRNVLRVAVTEFLCLDTPTIVVIAEAIEIARKYSGEEATKFVNGILDVIRLAQVSEPKGRYEQVRPR